VQANCLLAQAFARHPWDFEEANTFLELNARVIGSKMGSGLFPPRTKNHPLVTNLVLKWIVGTGLLEEGIKPKCF